MSFLSKLLNPNAFSLAADSSEQPKYGFLSPSNAAVEPAHLQVIKDRFLRNFDRVEVCDAINIDTSGSGHTPTGHLHIRFYLPDDVASELDTYKKIAHLSQEIDRGKFILNQYGITYHEDAVIEKKHAGMRNSWVQFDCDFPHPIENRGDTMRAIEADLQAGIERAKAMRSTQISAI